MIAKYTVVFICGNITCARLAFMYQKPVNSFFFFFASSRQLWGVCVFSCSVCFLSMFLFSSSLVLFIKHTTIYHVYFLSFTNFIQSYITFNIYFVKVVSILNVQTVINLCSWKENPLDTCYFVKCSSKEQLHF